ncbi:hypothetical protein TNIN_390081 [Trichonephila inaurata madagascariensis]|uniref:Uncharacterized protein n=1 Tax=Trichonephila inaurata madagascariensis TaxID=2747483 RepID=A0A8X7CCS3_9ARAC|nr:hypothetical protein TNIN_390081 [Trichonephila inaurata madagascariensis]
MHFFYSTAERRMMRIHMVSVAFARRKWKSNLVCAFPPPAQGPPQANAAVFLATRWVCFRCKKLDSDLSKQKPTRHFGRKNCLHKNA